MEGAGGPFKTALRQQCYDFITLVITSAVFIEAIMMSYEI